MTWEVFVELANDIQNHFNKQNCSYAYSVHIDPIGRYVMHIETKKYVRITIMFMKETKEFRIGILKYRYITDEGIWNETHDICELSREILVRFIENEPTYRMQKLFHASGLISDYYTKVLTKKKTELNMI